MSTDIVSNNTYLETRRGQPTDQRKKRPEFGMESKILGSARKGYFFRLQVAKDTPLYKACRYVSHQRVGFLRRLVWKRVSTLCSFWSGIRYGFWGNYGSLRTYLLFQFQMSKKEKEICDFDTSSETQRTPFTRAKKSVRPAKLFGTVLTILRHGTPTFRRVNVSVPNVMWHQCSKF